MGLLIRYLYGSYAIVAALLAWWYPAHVLVRLEPVDWGSLYEKRYTPPERIWGAMEGAKALLTALAEPLPLIEFIAQSTRDQVVVSRDESWRELIEAMGIEKKGEGSPVGFFKPEQRPFSALDSKSRYLEWPSPQGVVHLAYRFIEAKEFDSHSIPSHLRYPLRTYWVLILCWIFASVYVGFFTRGTIGKVASSSAGKGMRISAVFSAGFSGMIIWPFLYGTVGHGASFASIFMGAFFLFGSLVAFALFWVQASVASEMIERGRFIAHFLYDADEWSQFNKWDSMEEASEKSALWRVVFVISLLIGVLFMIIMRDMASVIVFCFLMAFMAVLWVLAIGLPKLKGMKKDTGGGEIYVGEKGVYVNGMVHTWNLPGSRFEAAEPKDEPLPHILLVYSQLQTAGRSLYFFRNYISVRIPIPRGMEGRMVELVTRLRAMKKADAR